MFDAKQRMFKKFFNAALKMIHIIVFFVIVTVQNALEFVFSVGKRKTNEKIPFQIVNKISIKFFMSCKMKIITKIYKTQC